MALTFLMWDQPTLEYPADNMIGYASGRSRIKIWDTGRVTNPVQRSFEAINL